MEEATSDYPCISSSEQSILGKVLYFVLESSLRIFFIDFSERVEKNGGKDLETSIGCPLTEDRTYNPDMYP